MHVFHTAGDPPSSGRIIFATIGSTMKTSAALVKIALANTRGARRECADAGRTAMVMRQLSKMMGRQASTIGVEFRLKRAVDVTPDGEPSPSEADEPSA